MAAGRFSLKPNGEPFAFRHHAVCKTLARKTSLDELVRLERAVRALIEKKTREQKTKSRADQGRLCRLWTLKCAGGRIKPVWYFCGPRYLRAFPIYVRSHEPVRPRTS
jgi:hypothetical protein